MTPSHIQELRTALASAVASPPSNADDYVHLCHGEKTDGGYRVVCKCGWVDATIRRSFAAAWNSMGRHLNKEGQ